MGSRYSLCRLPGHPLQGKREGWEQADVCPRSCPFLTQAYQQAIHFFPCVLGVRRPRRGSTFIESAGLPFRFQRLTLFYASENLAWIVFEHWSYTRDDRASSGSNSWLGRISNDQGYKGTLNPPSLAHSYWQM
eukprot:scaffold316077_cov21-Tisochrysis_lutea.AAC.1